MRSKSFCAQVAEDLRAVGFWRGGSFEALRRNAALLRHPGTRDVAPFEHIGLLSLALNT